MTLETFRAEFTLPFTRFYDRHTAHIPIEQLELWFHKEFPKHQQSVVELPHAGAFLESCSRRGIRSFLLSSIHSNQFAEQSGRISLSRHFERAYVEVRDKRLKIRELLSGHGLNPLETVFIGDMEHDIETARHGGVHAIAVLTGYNGIEQLRAAGPDLIVANLGELLEKLEAHDFDLARLLT